MLEKILIGVLCLIIGGLVSYFFTTILNRKIFKETVSEAITIHTKIDHKDSPSKLIRVHESSCNARNNIEEIKKTVLVVKTAVIFLVNKAGGDPRNLGL